MANPVCEVLLSELPLVAPLEKSPAQTGAVVDFWGVVRETEADAPIYGIEYEAHREMAEHQLRIVAEEAFATFPLHQLVIRHRLGLVAKNEASLFVRAGCKHRAEAFRAAIWVVDELKKRAPIWKHPKAAGAP